MQTIIILLLNIILAIWVHGDTKKFRAMGVKVTPGLWSTLVFLGSIPLFLIYILIRIFSLSPKSKMSRLQPLPPASKWTNWLTLIILFVVIGGILLSIIIASMLAN